LILRRQRVGRAVDSSWIIIGVGVLIGLGWGLYLYVRAFVPDGDTQLLVFGSHTAWACLQERRFPCEGVSQFALLQHIPAIAGVALGKTDLTIYRVLSLGSVLAVAGLTAIAGLVGRRVGGAMGSGLGCAIVLSGPFVYYDATTWGEPVAALFLALPIAALIFRWNVAIVFVAALLAAITKDVAPLTIVLLAGALLLMRLRTDGIRATVVRGAAVLAGAATGAVLTAGFNLFRYGVLHNAFYIDEVPRPPVGGFTVKAFGALWFSPSGGVIPYWPSMGVLLVLIAMSLLALRAGSWRMRCAHAALLGAFAFNTLVLASFAAPFGWIAWGPRLMLPWLVPALIVAVVLHRRRVQRACGWCVRWWGIATPIAVGIAVVGVFVNAAARFSDGWVAFFRPRPATDAYCPGPDVISWADPDLYFGCIGSVLWDRDGPIVILRDGLPDDASQVALVFSLVIVAFLVLTFAVSVVPIKRTAKVADE
jgi:hypothetical protein